MAVCPEREVVRWREHGATHVLDHSGAIYRQDKDGKFKRFRKLIDNSTAAVQNYAARVRRTKQVQEA